MINQYIELFIMNFFIFMLGACIGSFVNAMIYRIPRRITLGGRSYCENCKTTIKWYDLIPIISYIILGGRCRYCGAKIRINVWLLELLFGIIVMLGFNLFYLKPYLM